MFFIDVCSCVGSISIKSSLVSCCVGLGISGDFHFPWMWAPHATPDASVEMTIYRILILCCGPHGLPSHSSGGLLQKDFRSLVAGEFSVTRMCDCQPSLWWRQLYRSTRFSLPPFKAGEQLCRYPIVFASVRFGTLCVLSFTSLGLPMIFL